MEFLEEYYPWFLPTYNGYDHGMKRSDALRYFLMYHFGGMYIDMGFNNFKNLEPLLLGQSIVVTEQERGDEYPEGHSAANEDFKLPFQIYHFMNTLLANLLKIKTMKY